MPPTRFSLQDAVRVSDQVVFRELEGEAVLLNLETGVYFGLNDVGTRIWARLQQDGSLQNVFDTMQQQYSVEPQRLEKDILDLIEQMCAKGLVQEHLPTPV